MLQIPVDRFEALVADALDQIPDDVAALMDNVIVVVEDEPAEEGILGLYEGTPLTEREVYGGLELPDRITIYRLPICELVATEEEATDEVLVTVVHEVAHHFGLDDERLHQLGWA